MTPAQLRQAYAINDIHFGSVTGDGAGQTIAIIDAFDDPDAASDLHAFDQQFGLPDPPSFTKVNQNGGSTLPGTDPAGKGDDWELEESLDIEWTHAIAPEANIILVEANSPDDSDLLDAAVGWARSAPGVSAVSMSFGEPEASSQIALNSLFTTPSGHGGVTFIASTGDQGAPGGFPAYSPNVLAVGGTTLQTDSSGNYLGETGWSDSGGGISAYQSQPAYQAGVVTQTSTNRTIPDVAFDADPNSGVAVYDSYDFGASAPWQEVGGTSLAAPCWAGLIAIADQGRALDGAPSLDGATQTLPRLYSMPASNFHDITSGNNGYSAGPGYDLVAGCGSPVANTLVLYLSAGGPYVTSDTPSGLQSSAPTSIEFNFSTAMDPTSFSVASGVESFVGPGDANLLSSITGYSWLNGNTSLQVNFTPPTVQGPYTMTIGPQILSASGTPMDQNQNGVAGEIAGDSYSGTFYYDVTPTQVASTSPASGMAVTAPFTTLEVHFSAPIDPATVGAGNLTLSQGSVAAATMVDATTVQYTLSGIWQGGTVTVTMAQGALDDINGNPVLGFGGTYIVPAPAAPGTPTLLAATDSGVSDSDDVTNFDNSSAAKALQFSVPGTIPGDIVSIYSDGTLIGSTTATSTTTTVVTNGTRAVTYGIHSITARQSAFGVESATSSPLPVTILNTPVALPTPGALDTTFDGNGLSIDPRFTGYGAEAVVVQPDGKTLVAGSMTPAGTGATVATIARYSADGQLDPTFGSGGYVTIPSSDGDQTARSIALRSNGQIVVLVTPAVNIDAAPLEVARLNSGGSLDRSFGNGGIATPLPGGDVAASTLVIQPDGKLLIAGTYWNSQNQSFGVLIRLSSDGSFDSTFNGQGYLITDFGGASNFSSAILTSNGDIVAVGEISPTSYFSVLVARYTASGTLDTTFGNGGYVITSIGSGFSNVEGIALQPDGRMVVSAVLNSGLALVRYDANGTLDPSFGNDGIVTLPTGLWISAPVVQSDGKILVAGQYDANGQSDSYRGFVDRFNTDGSFDPSFGGSGQVLTTIGSSAEQNMFQALTLEADGRIIAVGVSSLNPSDPNQSVWTVARFFGGSAASISLEPSGDSDISDSELVTNVTTPTFEIPDFSGLYTRIYDDGVLVSSPYATGGTITLGPQPGGINSYTMSVVDAAGNESPATAPYVVVIDTTPPTASASMSSALSANLSSYSFTLMYSDNNAVAASTLGDGNVWVTGPDGYSQFATLVSATPLYNAPSITATYRITPPAGGWGPEGTVYTLRLEANSVTDVAGNAAASVTLGTIAVSSLTPPGEPQLQAVTDSGIGSTDGITNFDNSSSAKALEFLVPDTLVGATVSIYADGNKIGSAVATGSATLVTTDGTFPLSEGPHSITARQALGGTQTADSAALSITVHTIGPIASIAGPLVPAGFNYDFTVEYADAVGVNSATLDFDDLRVFNEAGYDQFATLISVSQQSGGTLVTATYQIAPPSGGWSSGGSAYTVSVQPSQVGDIAGNFTSAGPIGTLSLVPAGIPAAPALTQATDSGIPSNDDITNFNNSSPAKALQLIVSSTVPGDTVTIYADGVAIGSAVAMAGTTTITTDGSTALSDGPHTITAQQASPGQLASAVSPALDLTIQTIAAAPSAPALAPSSDSGFSNTDGVTNVIGPTVNVSASEAGTVFVQVDGSNGPVVSASASGPGMVAVPLVMPAGFQAGPVLSCGQADSEIATADFGGNGIEDIAVLGTSVEIFFGNGNGTFQPPVTIPNTSGANDILVADFNGDGKPDLWLRVAGGFEVLLNSGNGTFQPPVMFSTSIGYHAQVADINGDGKMDIIGENNAGNDTFSVWLGNGNGTFQAPYAVNAGLPVSNLIAADLNGDGKPDVVAVGGGLTPSMAAILNTGSNTFAAPVLTPLSVFGPNWLATADFNGDGKADILIGNAASTDQVFVSNGDGTFKAPFSITTASNSSFVAAGMDFNGDGKADAVIGVGNTLYVCYGNGDGTFQSPVTYSLGSNPSNIAFGDFNGEGAPDIATVSNLTSNNVSVLLATGGALRGGTYTLAAWETDRAGNVSSESASTTVTIDPTPPRASNFVGPTPDTPASATHIFTVTYSDILAMDAGSLDGNDILVTGPNSYSELASFVSSATPGANTGQIVATYQLVPPAGGWSSASNGTYTATIEPFQISDTAGNYCLSGAIGTLAISITDAPAQPKLLGMRSPTKAMEFWVGNTAANDAVTIYADGIAIGSAIAAGKTTNVVVGDMLADGIHVITARQAASGSAQSVDSAVLSISIDSIAPSARLSTLPSNPVVGSSVTIAFSEPAYGLMVSNIDLSLGGQSASQATAQTLMTNEPSAWTAAWAPAAGQFTSVSLPNRGDMPANAFSGKSGTAWSLTASTLPHSALEIPSLGFGSFSEFPHDPSSAARAINEKRRIIWDESATSCGNPRALKPAHGTVHFNDSSIWQAVPDVAGSYPLSFAAVQGNSTERFTFAAGGSTAKFLGVDTAGGDNMALIDDLHLVAAANAGFRSSLCSVGEL